MTSACKTGLKSIIRQIESSRLSLASEVAKAEVAEVKAEEALDRFKESNKEYRKLEKISIKASEARRVISHKVCFERRQAVLRLQVLLDTEGPTEAVAAEVREAARRFLGVE